MTIQEMHIGIDLGIQRLNSNVFGKLLHEAKDYFINTTTKDLVRLALTDERNTVFDIATYSDIREYYEKLQVYIRSIELGLEEELGSGYVYGVLPKVITNRVDIKDGLLYNGARYKVLTAGTTDLTKFGYSNPPIINETFECKIDNLTGTSIVINKGSIYKIVNINGISFMGYGSNDEPGNEFVATASGTVVGNSSTILEVIADKPSWDGTTNLILKSDIGYFLNIRSKSTVIKGSPISSGILQAGKKYIVKVKGTTKFNNIGGVEFPDLNYILIPSITYAPTWDGTTVVYELEDVDNRLVKMQDVGSFLQNSFGSVISSPVSVFADNKLRVYHNNKFKINRISLDYIKQPIDVNYNKSIDSDLPESVQPFLIDLVIKRIAAFSGNPIYNAINNEVREETV